MSAGRLRIVVAGLIAQHPALGGMSWHYLHYLIGLERLGHDVYYIEDSGLWPYNSDGGPTGNDWIQRDCSPNIAHLRAVLNRYGLGDRWAYRFPVDGSWHGLSDRRRTEVVSTADVLLNVSGSLERPADYRGRGPLVYIDTDPAFTQVRVVAGLEQRDLTTTDQAEFASFAQRVSDHDVHFTFAEGVHAAFPDTGHKWLPTRQPIVMDEWRSAEPAPWGRGRGFTTVMSWSSYRPLVWDVYSLGQKDVEFRTFLDLPARCPNAQLQVALSPTPHREWESPTAGESATRVGVTDLLTAHGWRVCDASVECGDIDRYRDYILHSTAEWSVAKSGYVTTRSGWFSDRTGCYLAAGRPAVVQDTGLDGVLPVGDGLLTFSTMDEAAAGLDAVMSGYRRHSRVATELAREYLDAENVLTNLLSDALG